VDILPKKKVTVVVKRHTVNVGTKKPNNGHPPEGTPPQPILKKKGLLKFLKTCGTIVKEDLHLKRVESDALFKNPDEKWEAYLKFLEMAEGGRKE
jgi:hypothetical protein